MMEKCIFRVRMAKIALFGSHGGIVVEIEGGNYATRIDIRETC